MGFIDRLLGRTPAPDLTQKSGTAPPAAPPLSSEAMINDWSRPYNLLSYPGNAGMLNYGLGFPSETGQFISPEMAMQSGGVFTCIKVLSENIAKLPVKLRKRLPSGGYEDIKNHPLNKILKRPNRWSTPFEFWANLVWSHQLYGNAFAYVRRGRNGDPLEIIFLNPARVRMLPAVNGRLYYEFTHKYYRDQTTITCRAEDMIHVRNMSLRDGFIGNSAPQLCQTVIGLDLSCRAHAAKMWKQGTTLSGLLRHPGKLTEVAMANIRSGWNSAFGGVEKSHQVAVVQEGIEFTSITQNAEESQLHESRRQNTEEIAALFGVPLHKIGGMDRATFSNIEDLNQQFIDDSLMSIAKRFEEALEQRCLREAEIQDHEVRFDFTVMLRGNSLVRAQGNQILKSNGVISANEWRENEGLTPSTDEEANKLSTYENLAGKGPAESTSSTVPKANQ